MGNYSEEKRREEKKRREETVCVWSLELNYDYYTCVHYDRIIKLITYLPLLNTTLDRSHGTRPINSIKYLLLLYN